MWKTNKNKTSNIRKQKEIKIEKAEKMRKTTPKNAKKANKMKHPKESIQSKYIKHKAKQRNICRKI